MEGENSGTQCQSDECRRTLETLRVLFRSGRRAVHRPPRCRARQDTERVLWQGAGVREREINGKKLMARL